MSEDEDDNVEKGSLPSERLPEIARTMLMTLQQDPRNYRNFGIWWWPVKALLKKFYTRDNLYMLGDYEDPEVAAMVPEGITLDDMLTAALEEYSSNAQFNMLRAEVSNLDGEPVTIWDEDAGM